MPPRRGSRKFFNPETGVHIFSVEDLGPPWIHGNSPTSNDKLSQTRRERNIRHSPEVIERIRKNLLGVKHKWRPGTSYANAVRGGSDCVYLLKMWNDGQVWGKWGSSSKLAFLYREREFHRKKFNWEVLMMMECDDAPVLEYGIGLVMSYFPLDPHSRPSFFGETETFIWNTQTEALTNEIIKQLSNP